MVTFSPVAVVSVNPEKDTLVIVPADPPAAGPDLALEPLPDPNPPAGLLVAAGEAVAVPPLAAAVPGVLLQAATVATTTAAAPPAMTLPRLLENICLTPIVEILDLRFRRPSRKCRGKSLEGDREVVQHGLRANPSAKDPQDYAKATCSVTSATPQRRNAATPQRRNAATPQRPADRRLP
jgi:hypothetical protein